MVTSIVIFLLFIVPFFALWKTQNGRCCFFYGCGVSGFIVNVALFVSMNKKKDGKQKNGKWKRFPFLFSFTEKRKEENVKRLPLFPFCFIFRFPLSYTEKSNKSRKLTAKTVSAVHFLFPFLFTFLRFSCRYKRKEQKNENGKRLPSTFLLSLCCFQHS